MKTKSLRIDTSAWRLLKIEATNQEAKMEDIASGLLKQALTSEEREKEEEDEEEEEESI